jgi:mono/diheme cytochrome c family protein
MTLRPALLRTALAILTLGAGAQVSLAAQNPQLVRQGQALAESMCADCHTLGGARRTDRPSPDFAEIAAMPSTTPLSLRVFLKSPHRDMPDLILSDAQINALVAYILELGGK